MNHTGIPSFISCDWGTSRLRLCAVDAATLEILAEYQSDQGIAPTYENWKINSSQVARPLFYAEVLARGVTELESSLNQPLPELPLICSGMASSALGLEELSYATLPFPLDGSQAHLSSLNLEASLPNPILLISGLRATQDIMRGEETEILGYHVLEETTTDPYLALLPGTHSKHIHINQGKITDFQTYMTGEVFQLLKSSGTLQYSVEAGGELNHEAFARGVLETQESPLLTTLFRVRAYTMLQNMNARENHDYLSGLLIGSELRGLKNSSVHLVLLANRALGSLYATALQILGMEPRLTVLPASVSKKAVFAGQLHLYQQHVVTL